MNVVGTFSDIMLSIALLSVTLASMLLLSAIILRFIIHSVVMLNVIMVNVAAPWEVLKCECNSVNLLDQEQLQTNILIQNGQAGGGEGEGEGGVAESNLAYGRNK